MVRFNELRALVASDREGDLSVLAAWPLAVAAALVTAYHERTTHVHFIVACKMQRASHSALTAPARAYA